LFGLKEQQDAEYRMKHPTANLPEGSKGERRDKLGSKAYRSLFFVLVIFPHFQS